MGQLNLALLGTPQIRHGRQVVPFRTRKALALLIYLVVKEGMHSREKLADLFWPESEEQKGRALLRNTLVLVRKTLGEMNNPSHLLTEQDAIGFNLASDFALDLNTVQAAWELTRTSPGASREQDMQKEAGDPIVLTQLSQVVTIYRGDFLEGFSLPDAPDFDSWCVSERAYWHRRMDAIFQCLVHLLLSRGEIRDASEIATRWITHDPFNEMAYQRLMQVQRAAGDRTAALQTYGTCRAMLAKEFHARPAPETEALAERIRVDESSRRLFPPVQARGDVLQAIELPLVGRGDEHSMLVRIYHMLRIAGPQVATLVGEAGIGKTRFANEFLSWARAQSVDVLQGQAFEAGGRLPYQPLVEALRSRLAVMPAPGDMLPRIWLAELARLLPELRESVPDLPSPPSDEATAQTRLFESVARLFQALAKRASLVIFIDDLQWADVSSLDLLHYICRSFVAEMSPVLLLFNLRSETLAITPELTDWLSSLERDLPITQLTLGPLTPEGTTHLIRSLTSLARTVQAESRDVEHFGCWLYTETGGQPFFIMETLKTLVEQGLLTIERTLDGAHVIDVAPAIRQEHLLRGILPGGVRGVIRARLACLPTHALSLLMAGAVLGKSFAFARLCLVARIAEYEGLPALEALLTGRLLTEVGHTKGHAGEEHFLFAHDKIRDVVYAETGSTRRRLFHRQALETLQAASASPTELAHHALAAGLSQDAYYLSIAAGDEAMRLFAVRDALTHYEQAWRLARSSAEDTLYATQSRAPVVPSNLFHLSLQLGWAYELSSKFAQATRIYDEMLALAREMHEPARECTILNRLANLAAQESQDRTRVEEFLHQALIVAESSGNRAGVAETVWNLAQTGFYAAKMTASLPHAERALSLARELNLQELIGRSLHVLAILEAILGKWEESLAHAEEGRARYVASGDRAMEVKCLDAIAEAKIHDGQLQEGIKAGRAAFSLSVEWEYLWGQINTAFQLVPGLLDSGSYTEALSLSQQGIALAKEHELLPFQMLLLTECGNVYREMLALSAAHAAHSEALALCERFMPPPYHAWIASTLCADAALAGKWQEAYTYAKKAALRKDLVRNEAPSLWHQTEALLRGGSPKLARELVDRFGEQFGKKRRYRIHYLRALTVLAQWDKEIDQALAYLEAALLLAEELGLPGERWQILASLGELHQSYTNESQARQAFARAAQIVHSLANRIEDEQQRITFLSAQRIRTVLEGL